MIIKEIKRTTSAGYAVNKVYRIKNIILESNDSDIDWDDVDILVKDGKFYYSEDGVNLWPVPRQYQRKLRSEYEDAKRLEEIRAVNPEYDPDSAEALEAEKARMERIRQSADSHSTKIKGAEDKRAKFRSNKVIKKKKVSAYSKITTNSTLANLKNDFDSFVENLIVKEVDYDFDWGDSYSNPSQRYRSVVPDLIFKGRSNVRIETETEKELPCVYFYYDRSSSWRNNQRKLKLGDEIVALFEGLEEEGKIAIIKKSFDDEVHDGFVTCDGGNNGAELVRSIRKETAGRLANVVIMTDGDNKDCGGETCVVGGNVWIIFVDYAHPGIAKAVRGSAGADAQYFFQLDY